MFRKNTEDIFFFGFYIPNSNPIYVLTIYMLILYFYWVIRKYGTIKGKKLEKKRIARSA